MENKRLKLKIFKSNTGICAQLLEGGNTVIGKKFSFKKGDSPVKQSEKFGEEFGKIMIEKGYKLISYDRGKSLYHGNVKSFAEGLRKLNIDF